MILWHYICREGPCAFMDMSDKENLGKKVELVYDYRINQLEQEFKPIDREGMSDEEYQKALQTQYISLRQKEFEDAYRAQGYDMYNYSRSCTIAECKQMLFQNDRIKADRLDKEIEVRGEDFSVKSDSTWRAHRDSVVYSAPVVVKGSLRELGIETNSKETYAHCAQTAACIATAVCKTMDLPDVTDGAEVCLAAGINGGKCHNERYVSKVKGGIQGGLYSNIDCYNQRKTLGEMVASGDIKAGTIISEYSGNTGSKMHTLSVIDVQKNEQGTISYTVMDNNGGDWRTRIRQCTVGGTDPISIGCNKKIVTYTSINSWANNQFSEETKGKSIEELEAMIAKEKERAKDITEYLAMTENTLLCDESYKSKCGGINRANGLSREQGKMIDFYEKGIVADADQEIIFKKGLENMAKIDLAVPEMNITMVVPEIEFEGKGKKMKTKIVGERVIELGKIMPNMLGINSNENSTKEAKSEEIVKAVDGSVAENMSQRIETTTNETMQRAEEVINRATQRAETVINEATQSAEDVIEGVGQNTEVKAQVDAPQNSEVAMKDVGVVKQNYNVDVAQASINTGEINEAPTMQVETKEGLPQVLSFSLDRSEIKEEMDNQRTEAERNLESNKRALNAGTYGHSLRFDEASKRKEETSEKPQQTPQRRISLEALIRMNQQRQLNIK